MNFAILGSCVGGDIINKANKLDWKVVSNHVSYSTFSVVDTINQHINTKNIDFSDETPFHQEILKNCLHGNILQKIKDSKPQVLLVDLSDLRIAEDIFELENGFRFFISSSFSVNEKTLSNIKSEIEKQQNSKIICSQH